jgi:hypothetical protein
MIPRTTGASQLLRASPNSQTTHFSLSFVVSSLSLISLPDSHLFGPDPFATYFKVELPEIESSLATEWRIDDCQAATAD